LQQSSSRYTELLPYNAIRDAFALSQDVRSVTTAELLKAGAQCPAQWLIVGGWECQDLSFAGSGLGINGPRSGTIYELLRIVGTVQQLRSHQPPAYIIENVAFQYHSDQRIAHEQFSKVCHMLGTPVTLDAAQFGSAAHRVRNFWTNLCDPTALQRALAQVRRDPALTVYSVLDPGRHLQRVVTTDRPPRYICNHAGCIMAAWPTLVSYPQSYAFRPGQPGSITYEVGGQRVWDEPNARERERALGYPPESTAAPGVTEQQRRAILGRCIDANTAQAILAIAIAWWGVHPNTPIVSSVPAAYYADIVATPAGMCDSLAESTEPYNKELRSLMLAMTATALEAPQACGDIWLDHATLHTLQSGEFPQGINAQERSRINKRKRYYVWRTGTLLRVMHDGTTRIVPTPSDRMEILKRYHLEVGHFGARRTAALAMLAYWWHGIHKDSATLVSRCDVCHRVRTSFNALQPTLTPLPINGMFYRWGVDLCGPFPESKRSYKYIMVCIEHFSKWVELIPLKSKEPRETSTAFLGIDPLWKLA